MESEEMDTFYSSFYSSDFDSVELITSLTTPISDFHWVVSSLTTSTGTPSLVKTSLKWGILAITTATPRTTPRTTPCKNNVFLFYLRMSQLCRSAQCAYQSQNLLRLNMQ